MRYILFICLVSLPASADIVNGTNQMLWIPASAPNWSGFGNFSISYPSLDAYATVTWPAYIGTGTVINGAYTTCSGKNYLQSKTIRYGIPEKYELFTLTSDWKLLGKRGDFIYYGQTKYLYNELPDCHSIGSSFNGVRFPGLTLKLTQA